MEDTLNRQTQFGGAKLIIGIFFVLHGLILAADNLGLLDAWHYLRYWPVVVLLVGIYRLWQPGRQLGGIILTVVGASLLAHNAGLLRVSIFDDRLEVENPGLLGTGPQDPKRRYFRGD